MGRSMPFDDVMPDSCSIEATPAATSVHVDRLIGATPSARSFAPLVQYDAAVWRMNTASTAHYLRTSDA
ncbi:MAG: hypothetical protein DI630_28170 [Gordonia sp. (in: high G+C Gram-positive bacteria)]|nr:MAG: hypothetical protein DI630_28170 [Gordonia sp. (in: high G+C Gram-positive bacteria)]